jgi:hypothetical protein
MAAEAQRTPSKHVTGNLLKRRFDSNRKNRFASLGVSRKRAGLSVLYVCKTPGSLTLDLRDGSHPANKENEKWPQHSSRLLANSTQLTSAAYERMILP